jgi:hypothetical protein
VFLEESKKEGRGKEEVDNSLNKRSKVCFEKLLFAKLVLVF